MEPKKLEWQFYCSRLRTNSKQLLKQWKWEDEEQFFAWLKDKFVEAPSKDDELWKLFEKKKEKKEKQVEKKDLANVDLAAPKKQKLRKSNKRKPLVDKIDLTEMSKENKNGKETSN